MSTRITRKRFLALSVGTALVGVLQAACGNASSPAPSAPAPGQSSGPAGQPTTAATQAAAPASSAPQSGGKVSLRFMKFAGPGWVLDERYTKEFMTQHPNVDVKIEDIVYAEMNKKVLALAATNTLGDVYSGHNRWSPYHAYKGLGLDLDPMIKAYPEEAQFDDFFPSVIEDSRGLGADGKLFWFPTVVHPAGNAVVAFNLDMLDKAGVKMPTNDWTVKDYEEIVRQAARPSEGIYGTDINFAAPLYAAQALRSWSTDAAASSDDSWLVSRDGKKQQLDSPPIREGYEWYWGMVKDGLVPSSAEKQAMAGSGADHFVAGKMVSRAMESSSPHVAMSNVQDRFKIDYVLWPKGPNGHRGSALSYNLQMINSKTQHPDEAFILLTFLTGKDTAFLRGYEGVGQAGARKSAWFDPRMAEKWPHVKAVAEWFEQGVDPYPRPWNLRAQEHQDVYSQEIQAYLDGKEDWDQMFKHVQPKGQEVIDLPRP